MITVSWDAIHLAPGNATVRDLWARADRGSFANDYSVSVSPHGIALLRVVGTDSPATDGFLSAQPWTYMANEQGPVERNSSNGGGGGGGVGMGPTPEGAPPPEMAGRASGVPQQFASPCDVLSPTAVWV